MLDTFKPTKFVGSAHEVEPFVEVYNANFHFINEPFSPAQACIPPTMQQMLHEALLTTTNEEMAPDVQESDCLENDNDSESDSDSIHNTSTGTQENSGQGNINRRNKCALHGLCPCAPRNSSTHCVHCHLIVARIVLLQGRKGKHPEAIQFPRDLSVFTARLSRISNRQAQRDVR